MKNNKGKGRQHINQMLPSSPDDVQLGEAVTVRFLEVLKDHLRILNEPIIPPSDYDTDMVLWRTMVQRHRKFDFRHTADELKSTQRIAQWSLDIRKRLTGSPKQVLEWSH